MGLSQLWNLIWQNSVFHWATAIVFGVATVIEIVALLRFWLGECSSFRPIIKFLSGKTTDPPKKIKNWLDNHLKRDAKGKFQKQNNRYVLQCYPIALARPLRPSSLRFVPTILTAIGVLGTFYGIQVGLKDISPTIADSKELLASSQSLSAGMRTAFSTSLMGLGSSSLFTLVLAGCEFWRL